MHTAAGVRQTAPAATVTVTAAPESGSTVSSHRSRRRSTRPADVARPPATATTSSRKRQPFIQPTRSLNASRNVNAPPSCAAGRPWKRPVSGTAAPSARAATAAVAALVRLSAWPASSVNDTRTSSASPSSASTAV